ncbi:hypothetical protein CAEBREN_23131 [Caenorhabditis brenneri]|uniref:CUB-like domain-containing protein n=1 Tax=Caenorhabditis brenneri TaxID=135651 RepID=G0NSM5_CAEBE|nr:hypothetical protein CAEBREN_23131 [Caenorhabditis brenneri]
MAYLVRILLLIAVLYSGSGVFALNCSQIPSADIIPGRFIFIPDGASSRTQIPPNWDCTYQITVPPLIYATISLENGLQGYNDVIIVRDEQGTYTMVSSRSAPTVYFYVFPNTTTTFQVSTKSVDMKSSFRLVVYYQRMPNATVTQMTSSSLTYFELNDLQVNSDKLPQTIQALENISLSIAASGYSSDVFDNYFVIDGDFSQQNAVYRMTSFLSQNYISSGNTLTLVGLDIWNSESSVVLTPLSQTQQFDSLTSFGVYFNENQLKIDATTGGRQRKAVTVVSMTNAVVILGVEMTPPCTSLKAVSAPLTSSSTVLLDFTAVTDYPRNITEKVFGIIAENCAATLKMMSG